MEDQQLLELKNNLEQKEKALDEASVGVVEFKSNHAQPWTPSLVISLSFAILFFGLVVIVLFSRLVPKDVSVDGLIKGFGLIIIIIAAIFLVVTGYSQAQIAPVTGLLGVLAGYLLGNTKREQS